MKAWVSPYLSPVGEVLRAEAADVVRAAGESFENPALVTLDEARALQSAAQILRTVFDAVAEDDLAGAVHHVNVLLADAGTRPALVRHESNPV